jgi:hypothetical protein
MPSCAEHKRGKGSLVASFILKPLLILCLVGGVFAGEASARQPNPPAADASKAEVRNNAASLLADLLGKDKNVSKILIIKRNSAEFGKLIKSISKAADDGEKQLQALAKADPTLSLHALQLPPGEEAARAADGKATEHELLSSSGPVFEFNLLLSQAQALNYASNLAKVAADNSSSPDQSRVFNQLNVSLANLYKQVIARMRARPAK